MLWLGDTINALGTSVTVFVLPVIAVRELHATALAVGLLATARWLPALLVGLPAGAWSERAEKRMVLVGCNALSAAAMSAIPLISVYGTLSMAEMYGIVAVVGALTAVFNAAYVPYFSAVLTPDQFRSGISRIMVARTAALTCGPAVGGFLATLFSPPLAILADVASFAVSFLCLSCLPRSLPAASESPRAPLLQGIRRGISFLLSDPYLWRLTGAAALQNLLSVSYGAIEVIFLLRSVHAPTQIVGYLLAIGATGSILGSALVPRLTKLLGDAAALRILLLVVLPLSTLICLTQRGLGYAFFAFGELGMMLALSGVNVIVMTFRQARVPHSMLARVSATMGVFLTSTMLLGGVLGGALAEAIGIRDALWIILPCMILPGLTVLSRPFRDRRDLPAVNIASPEMKEA